VLIGVDFEICFAQRLKFGFQPPGELNNRPVIVVVILMYVAQKAAKTLVGH
jgi:hypothetical protein